MADGVSITAGSGTTVATDDCGAGGHAQIVKLAIATDGSATLIPAVAADGLLVNLGTNNDVTVTGTVTAAQATAANLNCTEASAAAIKTAVEIIDDWDESDRAKVNIVAGQAGITAGAGAVGASTPRVTLASDDPAVAALQILDNAISGSEMQVDVVAALPAGTNAIGKLAANSGVDIGDVDILSIAAGDNNIGNVDVVTLPATPAGTNLIGKVAAGPDVSNAYNGATAITPKFAKLSTASTGNQALVAAVADVKIRILALQIIATASTNAIYINDGTADLYGDSTRKIPLDVTGATGPGGITLPFNQLGWLETAAVNRPININLGSANGVIAIASYVEV